MTEAATPRLGLPYLAAGQAQKELTHNEALVLADAMVCASVVGVAVDAPPASPAPGQCWIVGAAPTKEWAGQAGALAVWTSGGWRFVPPCDGFVAWVPGERLWVVRDGGSWRKGELRGERLIIGGCDRPKTLSRESGRDFARHDGPNWDENGGFAGFSSPSTPTANHRIVFGR